MTFWIKTANSVHIHWINQMGVRGYRVIHDKKVIPLRIKLARLHQYTNNKSYNLGKKNHANPTNVHGVVWTRGWRRNGFELELVTKWNTKTPIWWLCLWILMKITGKHYHELNIRIKFACKKWLTIATQCKLTDFILGIDSINGSSETYQKLNRSIWFSDANPTNVHGVVWHE